MPNRKVGAVAAATFLVLSGGAGKRRRYWVRPSLWSRATYGACDLLADLRRDDLDPVTNRVTVTKRGHFKNFTRISYDDFIMLQNAIRPYVQKQDTNFRKAITVTEQLAVTLRFLATGDSYHSLSYLTKISVSKISVVVIKVCKALIKVLEHEIKVSVYYIMYLFHFNITTSKLCGKLRRFAILPR